MKKALLYVGDLVRKVDAAVPYASMALHIVPLLTPKYGETVIQLNES